MIRFDATEPQAVNTQVQKQVPLTGADSVVYDQWAKVGQQASQFALDVFEQRDIAASNNYAAKADADMSIALKQYETTLLKNHEDGYIGGRAINDLMNERAKLLSDQFVINAPSDRAKGFTRNKLIPTATSALMDADKLYTKAVADGATRRLDDYLKASAARLDMMSDPVEVSKVQDEFEAQAAKEYQNLGLTGTEDKIKQGNKAIFEMGATKAISIEHSGMIKNALLELVGNKTFSSFIDALEKKPAKVGVRRADGRYDVYDTATNERSVVELSKDLYREAPIVNISNGETYNFSPESAGRAARSMSFDEINQWTGRLLDSYFRANKKKKEDLANEVGRYEKALDSNSATAYSSKTQEEKQGLVIKIMESNQDIEDKVIQWGKIASSTAGGIVSDPNKMTVSDLGNQSKEQIRASVKQQFYKEMGSIISTLKASGREDEALALQEKVAKNTYFDAEINDRTESIFSTQDKIQEEFKRDPIGSISARYRNEPVDQMIASNVFSKDTTIDTLLKTQSNNPQLAEAMFSRQEELYVQAGKISVGAVREVLSKDQASELTARIDEEKDPVKLHDTLSKVAWLFKGNTKKFRQAMEQIKKPELASALALSKNTTTTLTILEAYSKGKAYEEAAKALAGTKRDGLKAAIFKDKKFRAQYNSLLSSSDPEGATRFHELVTDMAMLVKSRRGSSVPSDSSVAKYTSELLFADREIFNGNGGATLYDPKIVSAEALEVTEENIQGMARHTNIIIPNSEDSERYLSNLSKTAQYKHIGDGLYAVKSTTVKNGVAVEDYVFIRNPETGKPEYWTVTAEEINTYYSKVKGNRESAFENAFASPAQGTAGAFNVDNGPLIQRKPQSFGVVSNVVGSFGDNDAHMRNILMKETLGAAPQLKQSGIPFGRSRRHGMEIPLTSFTPVGRPNDEGNRQLAYGLTVRYANMFLKGDPQWEQYKANGYKFNSGTPEWQANKIDEWATKGYNIASKEAKDGMRTFLGIDHKYISPQAYKVVAQLVYSEGKSSAFKEEIRPVLKEALLNNDAYAMTKVLTQYKNYTIGGTPLNAYGKMVLSWLIQ